MSPEMAAEALIKEAMERGEFQNRRGQGKPVDLNSYLDTPAELRLAYTAVKIAGMVPEETELLKEIGRLKKSLPRRDPRWARAGFIGCSARSR